MKDSGYVVRLWRRMWLTWLATLALGPVIVIANFIHASSASQPLPWNQIPLAIGIMLFGTDIIWLSRRWFNFMSGEEICKWHPYR
jgi:hypothetical protein